MIEECPDCGIAVLPWDGGNCPNQCWRENQVKEDIYIVIKTGEGGATLERLTKSDLLNRLTGNYYGNTEDVVNQCLPDEKDMMYWGNSVTIFKGDFVVPQIVTTATSYDLD
jgi:hypothetical protein